MIRGSVGWREKLSKGDFVGRVRNGPDFVALEMQSGLSAYALKIFF
jgi:hypothetical protein